VTLCSQCSRVLTFEKLCEAYELTRANWTDSTFQPIAKGKGLGKRNSKANARGLPMHWLAGIDHKGHAYVSCVSYTFFRFEMTFKGQTLPAFLGLQVDDLWTVRSGELVRQRPSEIEGYPTHEGVAEDSGAHDAFAEHLHPPPPADEHSVFVSTLRASIALQMSEERLQCVTHNDLLLQDPWAHMSNEAIQVGKACFMQPLARQNMLLVRDSAWLYHKMLSVATSNGEIPTSAAHTLGFSTSGQVPVDPLAGQLIGKHVLKSAPYSGFV
jgi:hypothetical protein